MAFDTVDQVINDAAIEVGLTPIAAPFTASDANYIQLRYLLKSGGRALSRARNWVHLRREHTFVTVQGQAAYPYPADFRDMLDQTGWNRTNRLPLGGPVSAQEWQYLKSRLTGVVFTVLFRQMQEQIYLYPDVDTPGGYTIAFEYQSKNWVQPVPVAAAANPFAAINWEPVNAYGLGVTSGWGVTGNAHWVVTTAGISGAGDSGDHVLDLVAFPTAPPANFTLLDGTVVWMFVADTTPPTTIDAPAAGSDTVLLDAPLVVARLKLDFLKAKGFDTAAAQRDYDLAFDAAAGEDADSPVLTAGMPRTIEPLLGGQSVPFTGFGS